MRLQSKYSLKCNLTVSNFQKFLGSMPLDPLEKACCACQCHILLLYYTLLPEWKFSTIVVPPYNLTPSYMPLWYRLFSEGHVQDICTKDSSNACFIKANCLPEMKKDWKYTVSNIINKESCDVKEATYSCPAGRGPLG